ncbi:MAG TPA: hypothetical protein PLJ60_08290 [Chryseolinea sp.]|nr:hypothetical protein [Chryseolinea sp.]HPM30323.1 hypothetical protein [Chryseolinea sp.]
MRGKTVVSKRAAKPRMQSAQQRENRNRFKLASEWAKSILLELDKKVYYQKRTRKLKLPNAYTAVIPDYMRSVKVLQVN